VLRPVVRPARNLPATVAAARLNKFAPE